ncbi:polysaccharide deacetylase family protein [Nocardioides sp. SYSU DS0651]|uniref:polysaccharide deacetylase family protein n=1 Tax=Nocardioides sp. SYSU DS0651 TaxID=3415955 RepID=UPI003F4C1703
MSRPPVRVLMYHGVDRVPTARDPHGMFVSPAAFRDQVEHLLESGFVPISEDVYLAGLRGAPLPPKAVLITFDDGYVGVGEHAAPVLASFGVPSVLYVPAGLVGGWSSWLAPRDRHPLMGSAELRSVAAHGMAIGAHGLDHSDLTTVPDDELRRQTAQTRHGLESLLDVPIRSFAYPYGTHDARARAAVRAAGYEAGFAVHDGCDDLSVPRVDVNASDTMRTFRVKLSRLYPAARRVSGRLPAVRRAAHDLLGRAAPVPDVPAELGGSR